MLIPLAVGLLDKQGQDIVLTSVHDGVSLQSLKSENGDGLRTVVLRVEKVGPMTSTQNMRSLYPILCPFLWVSLPHIEGLHA